LHRLSETFALKTAIGCAKVGDLKPQEFCNSALQGKHRPPAHGRGISPEGCLI
jgi:hypothetical protein